MSDLLAREKIEVSKEMCRMQRQQNQEIADKFLKILETSITQETEHLRSMRQSLDKIAHELFILGLILLIFLMDLLFWSK